MSQADFPKELRHILDRCRKIEKGIGCRKGKYVPNIKINFLKKYVKVVDIVDCIANVFPKVAIVVVVNVILLILTNRLIVVVVPALLAIL